MLVEQAKEIERLKAELANAHKQLESKNIKAERAGSFAEAALQFNGVAESVDAAARQYLDNVKSYGQEKLTAYDSIIREAQDKADKMLSDASEKAEACEALDAKLDEFKSTVYICGELIQKLKF